MSRSWKLAAVLLPGLLVAGCGFGQSTTQPNGKAASLNLSLKTVPNVRSITVTPVKATFGNCAGGKQGNNTASTGSRLGYPNGICWVGETDPIGVYPIKITNTGIASFVYINGSSAAPSDGGNGWSLCNLGRDPATTCNGSRHRAPGIDQYVVKNFSPTGRPDFSGLSGTPECDREFGQRGRCWAGLGASQTEGFELIGPFATTDNASTNWTMTITWTPVPTDGS